MRSLTRRIFRERRRLAIVVTLAAAAGYLFYCRVPAEVGGVPLSWISAGMYGTIVGVSSLFICILLPSFRFAMEAFAISRLFYASAVAAFPALGALTVNSPFINAAIVVGGGAILSRFFYSDWLSRRFTRDHAVCSARLFRGDRLVRRIAATDADLEKLRYQTGAAGAAHRLHGMLAPHRDEGFGAAMAHGDHAGAAAVVRFRHARLPWQTLIAAWLDDAYGRLVDMHAHAPAAEEAPAEPATVLAA